MNSLGATYGGLVAVAQISNTRSLNADTQRQFLPSNPFRLIPTKK